ncbi:MAG: hypothetical protein E7666_05605 [Ruminococcaceae bacterium]|nr:hypothetical protein [Oscillospiraceae bacterium]
MTLTHLMDYIKNIGSKDVYSVLADLGNTIENLAEEIKIGSWILFLIGLAITVGIGFFGYKLIKLVMGLGMAYVGYFVGVEFFALVHQTLDWIPAWCAYICGAVIALLFMAFAFVKFSYTIYAAFALIGYCVVMFYTENTVLALGGAVLLATLSVSLIRTVFITATSFFCGMLTVTFLSKLLPALTFLQFGQKNWGALVVAAIFFLVYLSVQFAINRKASECIE